MSLLLLFMFLLPACILEERTGIGRNPKIRQVRAWVTGALTIREAFLAVLWAALWGGVFFSFMFYVLSRTQ